MCARLLVFHFLYEYKALFGAWFLFRRPSISSLSRRPARRPHATGQLGGAAGRPPRARMVHADDEVSTSDDEFLDGDAAPPPEPPPAPPAPAAEGSWETLHNPEEPKIEEELDDFGVDRRPFVFFLQLSTGQDARRRLHKITLPRSWSTSAIGRLTDMLSNRAGLPACGPRLDHRTPLWPLPRLAALRAALLTPSAADRHPCPQLGLPPPRGARAAERGRSHQRGDRAPRDDGARAWAGTRGRRRALAPRAVGLGPARRRPPMPDASARARPRRSLGDGRLHGR